MNHLVENNLTSHLIKMHQIYPHTHRACVCVRARFECVCECMCVMKCVSHVCLYVYTTNTSVTTDQMLKACSVLFSVTPKKSIMNIIFCWNNMELNQLFFFNSLLPPLLLLFWALWTDYFGRAFETKPSKKKIRRNKPKWSWLNVTLNGAYRKTAKNTKKP